MSAPTPHLAARIAVIGGGISGLAAAHRLTQLVPKADVRLYEGGARLGGPLHTLAGAGCLHEQGADSFLTRDPWALDLCRQLGLEEELLPTNETHRRALVVARGRLEPVPAGFVLMQPRQIAPLLRSPILGWCAKLRALAEPWVAKRADVDAPDYDESVASFATRRLGREVYERLVEPLLAGIYVADATKLSLAATFPEFLAAEREHGGLRRAWKSAGIKEPAVPLGVTPPLSSTDARANATAGPAESGARYGAFLTLRGGLGRLVDALAARLPTDGIVLNRQVAAIERTLGGRWRIPDAEGRVDEFDGVIVAVAGAAAARLVGRVDTQLGVLLARIQAASSVVATLVYRREQIARPLDGFGFVVPRIEKRQIVAASFPSVKFTGRSPAELVPVRVFLGGALRPEMIDRDDAALIAIARQELSELIGASGEPVEALVARWRDAMPQYHVGHVSLVDEIDARMATLPGLELAGNSYRGVGIPQCIRSGQDAAERLAFAIAKAHSAHGERRP